MSGILPQEKSGKSLMGQVWISIPGAKRKLGTLGGIFSPGSPFASVQDKKGMGKGRELPCSLPCNECGPDGHSVLDLLGSTRNHPVHWE